MDLFNLFNLVHHFHAYNSRKSKINKNNHQVFRLGDDGPEKVSTDEIFKNKKVVLFAFPAAFTGTCSRQLPSFNAKVDEFKVMFCMNIHSDYKYVNK